MFYEYDHPKEMAYRYNPILHGPWIFKLGSSIFEHLGASLLTARLPSLCLGILMMFIPYLCYRLFFLPLYPMLLLSIFTVLSPHLVMWSSFVQLDFWVLIVLTLMVVVIFQKKYFNLPYFWVPLLVAIHGIIKENVYVHVLILFVFFTLNKIYSLYLREEFSTQNSTYKKWFWLMAGTLVGIFLYVDFYSSHFRHFDSVLDGLYRKSLFYWWDQHKIERIAGPFSYHLIHLSWYELGFILFFIRHGISFFYELSFRWKQGYVVFLLLLGILYKKQESLWFSPIYQWLKLKIPIDVVVCFFFIGACCICDLLLFKEEKNFIKFPWIFTFFLLFYLFIFGRKSAVALSLYFCEWICFLYL
jgi:uncharacterized protein (TIGR03663 family)